MIRSKYKIQNELQKSIQDTKNKLSMLPLFIYTKLIEFITKDYEQTFNKTKERQINKIQKLLANSASSLHNNITEPYITQKPNTNKKENVINLSDYNPTEKELEILSLGLNFAVPPSNKLVKNLKLNFISSIETNFKNEDIEEVEKEIIRRNVCKMIEQGRTVKPNNEIFETIKNLTNRKEITILKADKGNATVIMNTTDYHNKVKGLIDNGPYSVLTEDPTNKILKKLKSIYKRLKDSKRIDNDLYNKMIDCNPRISKFFGLPKIHKKDIPFRPINDYRNSVHYKISRTLNNIISPTNQDLEFSNIKNSYKMMETLQDLQIPENCIFVSFDVTSLYTNLPIQDSILAIQERLLENNNWKKGRFSKLQVSDIVELLTECLNNTYFQYGNILYKQNDG